MCRFPSASNANFRLQTRRRGLSMSGLFTESWRGSWRKHQQNQRDKTEKHDLQWRQLFHRNNMEALTWGILNQHSMPTARRACPWMMMLKCKMHTVIFAKRVSDTERSNRLMQVAKHFLRCEKPLTFTPSVFLLSKLLAAVEGMKKKSISACDFSGSWARGYANMQQAYQSAALIFKLQVQEPTAESIM